ncbi:hypothetical protein PoB_005502000 [Plakobranchus ocellatus]|uniref:Secreted protein n=1 Tax=Plakobranchus ocellatus TaxID=259542 RepID=A0AAV4CAR6_9GAST|nr:hypothetical protein PoB_005502000 [Plakobranchus ocellatus]
MAGVSRGAWLPLELYLVCFTVWLNKNPPVTNKSVARKRCFSWDHPGFGRISLRHTLGHYSRRRSVVGVFTDGSRVQTS